MDLPQLFASRKSWAGSTRAMAERAAAAGYPISHVQLGAYARGDFTALPTEKTRRAIAAALFGDPAGHAYEAVTGAALKSVAPDVPDVDTQYAVVFLQLIDGHTDEEKRQTLGVLEATLRAMAASRDAAGSSGQRPNDTHSA